MCQNGIRKDWTSVHGIDCQQTVLLKVAVAWQINETVFKINGYTEVCMVSLQEKHPTEQLINFSSDTP